MLTILKDMQIIDKKVLAPLCLQIKCKFNGKSYKRLVFGKSDVVVQWLYNCEYVSKIEEDILEKIYSEIESK